MPRTGPLTKDSSTVALGLAQIRVGTAATYMGNVNPQLSSSDSIGALASTKFISNVDHWKLESGFPLLEDTTIPLRETASLECAFKEITPYNMALAKGIDPTGGGYADVHSGNVSLGALSSAAYIRMEALYTYPDNDYLMTMVFPRAQAISSIEMDLQLEDAAAVTVTFEAKRADSDISGGSAVWDDMPLGRIVWNDNS